MATMKASVGFILICVTVKVVCCSGTEKPVAEPWDRNDRRGLVMPLLQDVNEGWNKVRCYIQARVHNIYKESLYIL